MKALLAAVILLLHGGTALAYEEPKYDVVGKYEGFELRRYAPYIIAQDSSK